MGPGLSFGQWQDLKTLHSACPSASPVPHKQDHGPYSGVPPSFQPPAQSLPPRFPQLWMSRPWTLYGEVPRRGLHPVGCPGWGQVLGRLSWVCKLRPVGWRRPSHLLVVFSREGPKKGTGNSSQACPEPGWFCLVWA